jgi:hypothetical protein
MRFYSDELPVIGIRGVVESFEPNLFSEDPEMQISILCPKPDLIDMATTLLTGTVDGAPIPITYTGTAPTGFQLRIQSSGSYSGDLTLINDTPDESQRIELGRGDGEHEPVFRVEHGAELALRLYHPDRN